MHPLRFLPWPWLLLTAIPAHGENPEFKARCETSLPLPVLTVLRADNGYSINRQLSYRELNSLGEGLRHHDKENILGLTQAETTVQVQVRLTRLQDGASGQECVSPEILLTIEYKPIKIYIGREFAPDSCFYGAILQHEMRHLQVYRDNLPVVEAAVRARLGAKFDGRIRYGEYVALERRLRAEIRDEWLPVVDQELYKVRAIQARIDSPEEYDRIEQLCGADGLAAPEADSR